MDTIWNLLLLTGHIISIQLYCWSKNNNIPIEFEKCLTGRLKLPKTIRRINTYKNNRQPDGYINSVRLSNLTIILP